MDIHHEAYSHPIAAEGMAGHVMTLYPPFVLLNLLPFEMTFRIEGDGRDSEHRVDAGNKVALHNVRALVDSAFKSSPISLESPGGRVSAETATKLFTT